MKFALVDGQILEAKPGLRGVCRICRGPLVAKCGETRIWHWAHLGHRSCDQWWEPETEWHRDWKNQFAAAWQEVPLTAESGKMHIADVRTDAGWVIEFQHSYLRQEERRAREAFYGPDMCWVVDGLGTKGGWSKFCRAIMKHGRIMAGVPVTRIVPADACALLQYWSESRVQVLVDFGETPLWLLLPTDHTDQTFLRVIERTDFIEAVRTGRSFGGPPVVATKPALSPRAILPTLPQRAPLIGFERYWAERQRSRRRF